MRRPGSRGTALAGFVGVVPDPVPVPDQPASIQEKPRPARFTYGDDGARADSGGRPRHRALIASPMKRAGRHSGP